MEDNREDIVKNTEEGIEKKAEDMQPAADSVVDDDIQYTFVVPKGEIYREPEDDEPAEPEALDESHAGDDVSAEPEGSSAGADDEPTEPVEVIPEPADESEVEAAEPADEPEEDVPEPEKTIIVDRSRFTDAVNDALADAAEADFDEFTYSEDDFFRTYLAADPTGKTMYMEPPVYEETGLPEDDDITYTFVVPKGEVFREPDPEEERAAMEAEKARKAEAAILYAETKVMERSHDKDAGEDDTDEKKTRYGLPADHPGMGDLAQKQEARRLYKQIKKNRFRTRFYVILTILVLGIGWLILSNSSLFTIDSIVVQGNSHYTAEEIINMGHASPGRNIIYKANIKETKEYLENNPYIKSAEIRRRLPSTLVIKVTERKERLAFKYDDDYLIMDEDGILLKKTRNKPKTTLVQGVVVSKIKLGEKIGTENSKVMDKALKIVKMMIKSDLYYVKIDVSNEKTVKAYIYNTLVVKGDYDSLMTNMKNGRLHLVVEKLFADGIERGTITFLEDGSISFMPIF